MGAVFGNSAWDSSPYSFTGRQGNTPTYNDAQILGTFGGPIPTRGALSARPNLFVGYQRTVDHSAATQSGVVPTLNERLGDFSRSTDETGHPVTIVDPVTGQPFPSGRIPADRLSPEAQALLALYPQPNIVGDGRYNYQAPVLTGTEQDSLQTRVTQSLDARNQILGLLQYQRTRYDTTSVFALTSLNRAATLDASATWSRRFSPFFASRLRYQFSRATTNVTPHFAGVADITGNAGIAGADSAPENWGPPTLTFSSGLLGLNDVQYAESSAKTHGIQVEGLLNRQGHNMTVGGGLRRVNVDARGQQNGRGGFTFAGAATGFDLADFMLGLPGAATLALGNSDKALRANAFEAYFSDDWRVRPGLTINAGVRWDYEGPFSERQGRLSNLDVSPNFSAATVVTPSASVGEVTGRDFG